jgi:S-adenosylmethionine-diacylglycerol 3-amino-3-carboxypropyl transferase
MSHRRHATFAGLSRRCAILLRETAMPRMTRRLSRSVFNAIHGHHLVYNACWEDPRLDRAALKLGADDSVVMITSAGCNALDYVLDSPKHIYAVDVNPRQNALLELKQAAIRTLDFETFFEMFGKGRVKNWSAVYAPYLRIQLSPWARRYWDERGRYFAGSEHSFYFRGTTGAVARAMKVYVDRVARARDDIDALLEAPTVDAQRDIYDRTLRSRLWTPMLKWIAGHDVTLSLLAVPRLQREHLEARYRGRIADFMQERIETVFTRLPLADNYFWRVYLTGTYASSCCPEYLKQDQFERLKGGLVDRISTHTGSLLDFLRARGTPISRFVLLDHMDRLADDDSVTLEAEWQHLVRRATPGARVLWRSGGSQTDFVDALHVEVGGRKRRVSSLLKYDHALAARLHAVDRVHTYGSFHIAEMVH